MKNEKQDFVRACREYVKQAESFLAGSRNALPDFRPVCEMPLPNSTLCNPHLNDQERLGKPFPNVAFRVPDLVAANERFGDPWYFIAMRLLELSSGRFLLKRSKRNEKFYLVFAGPVLMNPAHSLLRFIAKPSPYQDVRQGLDHHDYRRVTLRLIGKDMVRETGQKARRASFVREDAIKFAVGLFREHGPQGTDLNADEYERLLRAVLAVADRIHECLWSPSKANALP